MKTIGVLIIIVILSFSTVSASSIEDVFQETIDLMLANHPSLTAQRNIIQSSKDFILPDQVKKTSLDLSANLGVTLEDGVIKPVPLVGLSFDMPLGPKREDIELNILKLDFAKIIQTDTQKLQNLKEELITNFTEKVSEILSYQHAKDTKLKLIETLEDRSVRIEELVMAGLTDPGILWTLDENIMTLEAEVADFELGKILLINATARNFAGDAWQEMRYLLEKIVQISKGVNLDV